jgi:hypothetical protein
MAIIIGTDKDEVLNGTPDPDTIFGLAGDDALKGFASADILDGGTGDDTLDGGLSIDVMIGGRGDDVYYVDNIADNAVETNRDGRDEIRTSLPSYTLGANFENLTYIAAKQFSGTGNELDNIIKGGAFDDTLNGVGGDDTLFGSDGNDTAVFAGRRADYTITTIGRVTTVADNNSRDGSDGTDTLHSLEQLKFADEVVIIGDPAARDLANLDGNNGFRVDGASEFDLSGNSVSSAGDVNNDGFDDFIIGARAADPDGLEVAGASYVIFGKAGGWSASLNLSTIDGTNGFRLDGTQPNGSSGTSVASAGDVNGDGFGDIIVGAPVETHGAYNAGASYVVFGKASGWSASIDLSTLDGQTGFRLDGENQYDFTGLDVSSAGDLNGDGFDDLTVSSTIFSYAGTYVVFGKDVGWSADLDLASLNGITGFNLLGSDFPIGNAVSAGDVNGDGFDDLLVGSRYADPDGIENAGVSYILFGKASGWTSEVDVAALDGTDGFRLDGGSLYEEAGYALASAGDINGDGFDDFLVGEGIQSNSYYSGGVSYVVFGKASGWTPTIELAELDGTDGFRIVRGTRQSIWSVSTAGDVNGDGLDDILIGAPFLDPEDGFNSGTSYVIYGKTGDWNPTFELSSLDATNGFRLDGQEGDQVGRTVSAAGDVNGDGFSDLIVGAEAADHSATDAGSSYIIFGGNFTGAVTHLGTEGDDTLTGTAAAENFVGGLGNDILNSGGGTDAFQGGVGNDTIRLTDPSFFHIDGGSGTDAIALDGAGLTFDLTTVPPASTESIERIDITGTGNNAVRLTVADVLDISDESNSLLLAGNAGDSADIGAGWTKAAAGGSNGDGTSTIDGQTYQHYNAGQANLLVDSDIGVLVS